MAHQVTNQLVKMSYLRFKCVICRPEHLIVCVEFLTMNLYMNNIYRNSICRNITSF
jgi:hypothetical protein